MARRGYGDGSIFQRKDGKWVGQFQAGYTTSGLPRRKSVIAPTQAKARIRLRAAMLEHASGETTLDPRATVKSWCDEWLPRQRERVRPAAWNADRGAVANWIIPTIGERRLVDLTPADVRKVHTAVTKKRSQATGVRVHATLSKALKSASLEGHNIPARIFQVPPPRLGTTDRAEVTVEQSVRLLKAAEDDPRRSRWVAALLQGMRQGECNGLTWDYVDLDHGLLDISWQLQPLPYEHGCGEAPCGKKRGSDCPQRYFAVPVDYEHEQIHLRWHLVRPKTASGRRVIPLLPWMVNALTEWRKIAPDSRLVWPLPDGRPMDPKTDVTAWQDLQVKAGVRHPSGRLYHLHEARHATATILMALGVDTQVIIAILGHASILSTRRYQHADLQMMRAALEGVAERLQLTA